MMLAILAAIPGIGALITGLVSAIFDAKVRIKMAQTGADRDKAVEIIKLAEVEAHERTGWLAIVASNPVLTWLIVAFATPYVIFIFKVVVWDIVLGIGTTDPIRGQVADWANVIIPSIFGSTTAVTVGKMVLSRREDGDGGRK
jgi:hypothetical protein